MKRLCVFAFLLAAGCGVGNQEINWRTDTSPIIKRVPQLSNVTNMLWHGEIITKNSFCSVPGPSTYRIVCFVPQASQFIAKLHGGEPGSSNKLERATLQKEEEEMLKSQYGIDLDHEAYMVNSALSSNLIVSPYWGECCYFKDKDVLCVILFGG